MRSTLNADSAIIKEYFSFQSYYDMFMLWRAALCRHIPIRFTDVCASAGTAVESAEGLKLENDQLKAALAEMYERMRSVSRPMAT